MKDLKLKVNLPNLMENLLSLKMNRQSLRIEPIASKADCFSGRPLQEQPSYYNEFPCVNGGKLKFSAS